VNLRERPYINVTKETGRQGFSLMGRIFKWLIYLCILAGIALVGYAYIGPFFGADFSAPLHEIREPVVLNAGN
jgi:hypothetical protein